MPPNQEDITGFCRQNGEPYFILTHGLGFGDASNCELLLCQHKTAR